MNVAPWAYAIVGAAIIAGALTLAMTHRGSHRESLCERGYVETDWPGGAVTCAAQ